MNRGNTLKKTNSFNSLRNQNKDINIKAPNSKDIISREQANDLKDVLDLQDDTREDGLDNNVQEKNSLEKDDLKNEQEIYAAKPVENEQDISQDQHVEQDDLVIKPVKPVETEQDARLSQELQKRRTQIQDMMRMTNELRNMLMDISNNEKLGPGFFKDESLNKAEDMDSLKNKMDNKESLDNNVNRDISKKDYQLYDKTVEVLKMLLNALAETLKFLLEIYLKILNAAVNSK